MTKNIALSDETYEKLKGIKIGSFNNTVRKLLEGKETIKVMFEDMEAEIRKLVKEEIRKAQGGY